MATNSCFNLKLADRSKFSLLSGPHIDVDFLLGLGYQAMDLFHMLPLNRNKSETVEEDWGENCHLKVEELVAGTLPKVIGTKGAELSSPASVRATRGKMVWVKPVGREKSECWGGVEGKAGWDAWIGTRCGT